MTIALDPYMLRLEPNMVEIMEYAGDLMTQLGFGDRENIDSYVSAW